MRGLLERIGFRLFLLVFVPFFFLTIVLAAPRMLLDWQMRRDWKEDFFQFFDKQTWVGLWAGMKRGRV